MAQISLEGPKDVWFGVGFAAQSMSDEPWAIIVDGQGEVSERKLGNHQAGTLSLGDDVEMTWNCLVKLRFPESNRVCHGIAGVVPTCLLSHFNKEASLCGRCTVL